MKQDEFERLNKMLTEMEASANTRADEQMFEALRVGVDIVERFVVALETIASHSKPITLVTAAGVPTFAAGVATVGPKT